MHPRPLNPDIAFEVKRTSQTYQGVAHFNLLKTSQSLQPTQGFPAFLELVKTTAQSSFKQIQPLPGQSSASIARLNPSDTFVINDKENPLSEDEISKIKHELLLIEAAWFDSKYPNLE